MEINIIWIIIAVVLLIVEVLTQMMWALCLTIGALGALGCYMCGLSLPWQITGMAIVSVIAYILLLPGYKKMQSKNAQRAARTGMDALLGRKAVVTHEIRPGQTGRARIDGDNWQVVAPSAKETIPAGAEVVVTSYDSIILTVNQL